MSEKNKRFGQQFGQPQVEETYGSDETTRGLLTQSQIEHLSHASIIPKGTPPEQVQIFAQICREKGLSPFSKEIYLMSYHSKKTNVTTYSPVVGIDGMRKIANRTGYYLGFENEPIYDGAFTMAQCIEKGRNTPFTCTVVVKKLVHGHVAKFPITVAFREFAPEKNNYNKFSKWFTMPFHMISIVAKKHALRDAFGGELSGLSVEEERAAYEDATITAAEVSVEFDISKWIDEKGQIKPEIAEKIEGFTKVEDVYSYANSLPKLVKDGDAMAELLNNKLSLIEYENKKQEFIERLTSCETMDALNDAWKKLGRKAKKNEDIQEAYSQMQTKLENQSSQN